MIYEVRKRRFPEREDSVKPYEMEHEKDTKFTSFPEAEKQALHFIRQYRCLSTRQIFVAIFNIYEQARISKLGEDKVYADDVKGDVERCILNFEMKGYIMKSSDGTYYYDPRYSADDVGAKRTITPLYQLVVWFHIFYLKTIGPDFILPYLGLDGDCLQFTVGENLYSVIPIPWNTVSPTYLNDTEAAFKSIDGYKQAYTEEDQSDVYQMSNNMREIYLFADKKSLGMAKQVSDKSEEPWLTHGIAAVFDSKAFAEDPVHPKFDFFNLGK